MAYLRGYDHDVLISHAPFDDHTRGEGEGWVSRFRKRLAAELLKRLGEGVDVALAAADDDRVEKAVRASGVLVTLISSAYQRSPGSRHVDWFGSESPRIVPVLLNNLPREEWPAACRDAGEVLFYDTAVTEYGHRLEPESEAFESAMREVRDRLAATLEALRRQQPGEEQLPAESFPVFLAATSDETDHQRLRKDLERRGVEVIGAVPPPWPAEEHAAAVREALERADLSVHLLGPYPGRPIVEDQPQTTHPLEQLRLGREHACPQLVLSETLALDGEETADLEPWYRDLLVRLATEKRDAGRLELVRTSRHQMAGEVLAKMRRLKEARRRPSPAAPRTAFVDLHMNDLASAAELLACLARNEVAPITVPATDLAPAEGMERFESNLRQAQLFIVVFGAVARGWVEERLQAAIKLVVSHHLATRMCVCVPSEERRDEVPFRNLVDVVVSTDPASIERILRKLDGEDG